MTVVVAALVLGEPLLLSSLLGGVAIILGVWLVNRQASKKTAEKQAALLNKTE